MRFGKFTSVEPIQGMAGARIGTQGVEAYDLRGDKQGTIQRLLDSTELSRRNIALYKNLGERYEKLADSEQAERAYATIVEMQPNESESHAMLAEIRQKHGRWDEAILHWQQVCRIRSLEPTGFLKLAEAQMHEKQYAAAKATIKTVTSRTWPERFDDVRYKAQRLLSRIEREGR